MFGLRTPCSISRRTQTGQTSSGEPTYSTATVWSGKCFALTASEVPKWQGVGLVEEGKYLVFLPWLTGDDRPQSGDSIVAGGDTYKVDFVPRLTAGVPHH